MTTLSVSTYCIREHLGPMVFDVTDPAGNDVHFELPYEKLLDLSDFPQRARETFGVDAIETVATQFAGLDDPELDRFASALESADVRLVNVAIDAGDLLGSDPEKRAADIDLNKQWIDRFAAMGSAFVRVNPGSPFTPHTGQVPPAYLVDALIELGDHAIRRGTRLLVENHGGPGSDPVWMNNLLDGVGYDRLGLLLDLGNFDVLLQPVLATAFAGITGVAPEADFATMVDSLDLTPLYDGIDALAGRAELVHVKVNEVDETGETRAVDLTRAFGILHRHGYEGPLTVEYEGTGGDPWWKTGRIVDITRGYESSPATAHESRR
ncbi:sugar phosphate isomerase/epimerase [Leifsonia sp. EB41]|uniref:sugar phosphate isomerase/epimerase family protein n=1 Tax=Leifsonia sp. EB41 TaxID=3156260 RepID=UPI003516E5E1